MHRTLLLAAALGLAGCAGDPPPLPRAGTPESCRAALVAALDGWKRGRTYQEMTAESPPLLVRDDDLFRGAKLLDYQIQGDGQARGTGYSYVVTLTLQDRDGAKAPAKKRVAYNAVSEPSRGIFREDRKP
jgi:hypothetical protein